MRTQSKAKAKQSCKKTGEGRGLYTQGEVITITDR